MGAVLLGFTSGLFNRDLSTALTTKVTSLPCTYKTSLSMTCRLNKSLLDTNPFLPFVSIVFHHLWQNIKKTPSNFKTNFS